MSPSEQRNSRDIVFFHLQSPIGVQWLSGRVLDLRPRVPVLEPHLCHCVVSLSKNINPSLVLVQPRKTCPFITERLLMGRKESNQTNKTNKQSPSIRFECLFGQTSPKCHSPKWGGHPDSFHQENYIKH